MRPGRSFAGALACAASLALVIALLSACDKQGTSTTPGFRNHAPEIQEVKILQDHVLAAEEVLASCRARDRDDADELKYWWMATDGSFPRGKVLPTVTWRTPVAVVPQTLQVWVTDFEDTATATLPVAIATVAPPESIHAVNGESVIDLSWGASNDEGVESWSGYELFLADHDLSGLPMDSLSRYSITPVPLQRLQQRVSPVPLGRALFFTIRSRRDYQGVVERSASGPSIETAARLDGFGTGPLYEAGSRRGLFGVRLPGGIVRLADPAMPDSIDFYLGTSDPQDGAGSLRLKSPSLLEYRDPRWASRVTRIQDAGSEWSIAAPLDAPFLLEVPVAVGHVYAILTADGHYAKVQISEQHASRPERRVEFHWAWQPIEDYPVF
ncbi:MAG: hypothetical protein ACE15D_00715 [Candidatus Eisenbacteria bacterium]